MKNLHYPEIVFKPFSTSPTFRNLEGCSFGRWRVLGFAGVENAHTFWYCRCACDQATMRKIDAGCLTGGKSQNCGCWKQGNSNARTHGCSFKSNLSPEYESWNQMKARTSNTNHAGYHRYGGRGITVCTEWQDSFEAFLRDMGCRPTPKHSIDRIDNNGNYEPGNCRWATASEQARNRRDTHWITYGGKTQAMKDWSRELGISYNALSLRLNQLGWSIERALSTP